MKKIVIFLRLTVLASIVIPARAQQNVVLLVDVSGSIPNAARNGAKDMVKDVLMGQAISNHAFYYEMDPQSTLRMPGTPLVSSGSHVVLIRFGEKVTSDGHSDAILRNFPADLDNFLDAHYPTASEYKDQYTFLTLAKAKAAQVAKQLGMGQFMFLLISDNINDDFTHGNSPNYTGLETQLVESYNSKSNPVMEGGIDGYVRLRGNNDFKIPLRMLDVGQMKTVLPVPPITPITPNGGGTTIITIPDSMPLTIEFSGNLASASRKLPAVVKSNSVNISWLCKNCPDNTLYNVVVSTVDGKTKDGNSKNLSLPSLSKNLESGTYKVMVSGEVPGSNRPVSSAMTYITVDTGGGAWFLWVVLIAGLIGGSIYMYKQQQKKKIREGTRKKGVLDDGETRNSNASF